MDIAYTPEQEAFRRRVQEFLHDVLPKGWGTPEHPLPKTAAERAEVGKWWEKEIYKAGFAGLSWPKKYGGQGLTEVEEAIFAEECAKVDAPQGINFLGKSLLGPTLLLEGTEEQKQRFLPPMLAGDEIWCEGYSEPDAGSDLAALKTSAVLQGDEWVINGEKIWTSNAHLADWIFLLARTDPNAPKHRGISFLLVPMHQPGITISPIRQITGDAEFNMEKFENARTAKENIVGEVNDGWRIANVILSFERGSGALESYARYRKEIDLLLSLSKQLEGPNGVLAQDSYYRQKLMASWTENEILRLIGYNIATQLQQKDHLGPEASIQKLFYS
ncbi:MAG: acyl-CoA dehydrogenase family protein, partial [Firmicutes bacterium]|nr:acyl-CoA dehydrogenase family protein [Bacillota bacterium]